MPSASSGNTPPATPFHEEQILQPPRRRWAVALPPAVITALAAGQMRAGHPLFKYSVSTGRLMALAVLGWAVYVWLSRVRLVTDVDQEGVSVRLRGLSRHHRIPRASITRTSIVAFDPEKDFGGYGIRSVDGGRAYVGLGRRGVRLELAGNGFAVVGSARPEALIAALKLTTPRQQP